MRPGGRRQAAVRAGVGWREGRHAAGTRSKCKARWAAVPAAAPPCARAHLRRGGADELGADARQRGKQRSLQQAAQQRHVTHRPQLGQREFQPQREQQQVHAQLRHRLDLRGGARRRVARQVRPLQCCRGAAINQDLCVHVHPHTHTRTPTRTPAHPPTPTCTISLMSLKPPGPTRLPATK